MLRLGAYALISSGVLSGTWAQKESSASDALSIYPSCAQQCIGTAFQDGLCAPTDQLCICNDGTFQMNITSCVALSCTIPESLATKNISSTSCGAEVRDRSAQHVVLSICLAVIAALFVIVRFAFKIFVIKIDLGLDDWFVLATMVAAVPSAFLTAYGTTANGLGRDIWTVPPDSITKVLMYFYVMACLYFLQATLVKLAILTFYMRIFPARNIQRLLWGTFILTSLWGTAYVIAAITQCRPISYFWTQWDGLHQGSCVDAKAIAWSNAAINIALDVWILAIPLWQLRTLQLHWKKKIGVALMFGVGTFVTVMSILRLRSLVTFSATSNKTWEFYDVSVWSTIEICVGIMCACLPTIRLLLVRVFPVLAGSTLRSTGYGVHTSSRAKSLEPRGTISHATTHPRKNSFPHSETGRSGIVYHKSYTVQYSDEASLVRMQSLDNTGKWQWREE